MIEAKVCYEAGLIWYYGITVYYTITIKSLSTKATDGGVVRERSIIVSLLHLAVLERQVDSLRNILEYIAKIRDRHGGGR